MKALFESTLPSPAAAVAVKKGDARIIVWGHNNLLNDEYSFSPKGKKLIKKIFNWLFEL